MQTKHQKRKVSVQSTENCSFLNKLLDGILIAQLVSNGSIGITELRGKTNDQLNASEPHLSVFVTSTEMTVGWEFWETLGYAAWRR